MTAATMPKVGTCDYCHTVSTDLIEADENRHVCRDARQCMKARHGEPEPPVEPPHEDRLAKPEPLLSDCTCGPSRTPRPGCPVHVPEPDLISGRLTPPPVTGPPHRLTFEGLEATWDADRVTFSAFTAICLDEVWTRTYDAGHTLADLEKLVRQHNGFPDGAP